ncbi:hypothetical protein KP509_03G089000 [Ceratopteris richardii]|uniref:SET domain-containing protein n=1 Tax=Ceratopteris richardii TaxID=49495 RepID=A0A8T2V1Y6_CERRI|nr:hypothetical protein KP509_03G089000 [Ceratopteris richardii]
MIAPSTITNVGRGLFIVEDLYVPPNFEVTLMSFCGPIYGWGDWHRFSRYVQSMSTYGICLNVASLTSRRILHAENERLYIDGRPYTHGNIAGLINSSRGLHNSSRTNCTFEEHENSHESPYMSRDVSRYIVVNAITTLHASDELLVNYGWRRPPRAPFS